MISNFLASLETFLLDARTTSASLYDSLATSGITYSRGKSREGKQSQHISSIEFHQSYTREPGSLSQVHLPAGVA
jgi:hypothetical protein